MTNKIPNLNQNSPDGCAGNPNASNEPPEDPNVPYSFCVKVGFLAAAIYFLLDVTNSFSYNAQFFNGVRSDAFIATAGSIASILGFVMTSAALLLSINYDHQAKWLEAGNAISKIFHAFLNLVIVLCLAFGMSFICLALDRDKQPPEPGVIPENMNSSAPLASDTLLALCLISFGYMAQTTLLMKSLGKTFLLIRSKKAQKDVILLEDGSGEPVAPWGGTAKSQSEYLKEEEQLHKLARKQSNSKTKASAGKRSSLNKKSVKTQPKPLKPVAKQKSKPKSNSTKSTSQIPPI